MNKKLKQVNNENENDNQNKYVRLKSNGRLFPTWLAVNFKKYKLPEIFNDGSDPCNKKISGDSRLKLKKYQEFIAKYLDYNSPFKNILIYHGVGAGKTASTINIYNSLYNYTPGWNVFLLIKASLKNDPWLNNLKIWLSKDEYNYRFKNIVFIHYDSPFAGKDFLEAVKKADSSKKNLFIIEECHNFISNVYSNISNNKGRRAQTIYDYIIQDKKDNDENRVICLSATPAINKPFELALLFNLLRPDIFPNSEAEFNHLFISQSLYPTISSNNKNMFQRRIMGLVTYYLGATPDYYASKTINYIDVEMSDYQTDIYDHFEMIEKRSAKKSKGSKMYKSYTRQSSNFVFPYIKQRLDGINRPRPNNFRLTEMEALLVDQGKNELKLEKNTEKYINVKKYTQTINLYISSLKKHFNKLFENDKNNKHTIIDDLSDFIKKHNNDIDSFIKDKKKNGSTLFKSLYKSSAKMIHIILRILISPGPVLVYSNYVLMEGLEVFKIYLNIFGFYNYLDDTGKNGFGFVEFHGGIKKEIREKGRKLFNDSSNKYAEKIKIIMISPAGAEGISLKNVRQVHIMEPYWHEIRIEQIIGRAIRQCSHKDLKMDDRHVEIYRYKSVSKKKEWTTDQYIEDVARSKYSLIQSFLDTIKEVAIDCMLYKNHNSLIGDYKCFQYEEQTLFDKYIGPAYKSNINDDLRINNGSNSSNSISKRIKVMEIYAVKLLSKIDEEPIYSDKQKYWYYEKTGVVYDYDINMPIGKIMEINGIPNKLDKDTFIINYLINIPLIN